MKSPAIFLCLLMAADSLNGAGGRALARGAAGRAPARSASAAPLGVTRHGATRVLKLDALTHRAPAKPLARPLAVQRYTTARRAACELKRGIPPGRHMTASATAWPGDESTGCTAPLWHCWGGAAGSREDPTAERFSRPLRQDPRGFARRWRKDFAHTGTSEVYLSNVP